MSWAQCFELINWIKDYYEDHPDLLIRFTTVEEDDLEEHATEYDADSDGETQELEHEGQELVDTSAWDWLL